jgi:serine/threonine-protein kinase
VWSPDSQSILFGADAKLRRIEVSTGVIHTVADIQPSGGGAAWSKDGVILFSDYGLRRVSAAGGTPVQVTALDSNAKEIGHFLPTFPADGQHFLYLRTSPFTDASGIYVGSLEVAPGAQDRTRLVATRAGPVYARAVDGGGGHLLFMRDASLMAQPLDPASLKLTGDAIPIAERLAYAAVPSSRFGFMSASQTDVVAYRHAEPRYATPVWVDRNGRELASLVSAPLESVENPRLSPDGRRVALIVSGHLWVYHLDGKPPVKLTSAGSNDIPLWTPDGSRLLFASNDVPMRLMSVPSDRTGQSPQPVSPDGHYHAHGWSSDGDLIAVVNSYSPSNWDIVTIPRQGEHPPLPIMQTSLAEGLGGAALSPDGRWLAYTSNSTGAQEVWVQPYSGPGAPKRISPNGGADPVWARTSRELFYLEGDQMMAVAVAAGPTFNHNQPVKLFTSTYVHAPTSPVSYDVAPDGRFLMIKDAQTQPGPSPITVVLNWTAGRVR